MTEAGPAIAVAALHKRFGDVVAVDGLDLEVRRGECFGLLGPNGAGKTTTLEIVEGLQAPSSGEVTVLGRRWREDALWLRSRLGITLQETRLPDRLTVREIVALFRSFYVEGPGVEDVIALVSLGEKANAWYENLSGGQKQRLAVACALVGNPELLFLDEPTTGLDPQSRRQLWDLVLSLKSEGRTVVLTTHYMDEAERLCDRVAVIDHGKAIALGSPRELIASVVGQEVVEFSVPGDGPRRAVLESLPSVRAAHRQGDAWALTVEQVHETVPALLALLHERREPLLRLSTHSATLEDVFVVLTGRRLRE